jgi:hypothetical protein
VFWFFSISLFKSFSLFDLFVDNEDEEATDFNALIFDASFVDMVAVSGAMFSLLFKLSLLLLVELEEKEEEDDVDDDCDSWF